MELNYILTGLALVAFLGFLYLKSRKSKAPSPHPEAAPRTMAEAIRNLLSKKG